MKPTPTQIEAAAKRIHQSDVDEGVCDLPFSDLAETYLLIAKQALTAAAEVRDSELTAAAKVGEPQKVSDYVSDRVYEGIRFKRSAVVNATIERCAKVADNFDDHDVGCADIKPSIAAAIRKLKEDKP